MHFVTWILLAKGRGLGRSSQWARRRRPAEPLEAALEKSLEGTLGSRRFSVSHVDESERQEWAWLHGYMRPFELVVMPRCL